MLELGNPVDDVERVEALLAVPIALVDGVDTDEAGAAVGIGLAADAGGDLDGAGLVEGEGSRAVVSPIGAQFTSEAFADRVLGAGVAFSTDGRGRFLDIIFIERLWRSLKYEAVYLHELRDGLDAERIIGSWFDFYNEVRPHSSLGGRTPGEAYRNGEGAV